MSIEQKIISAIYGPPGRELKFLQGKDKRAVDLMIAGGAVEKIARTVRGARLSPPELINMVESQVSLAGGFRDNKYVYYDGKFFLDCFAPSWPGPVFQRGLDVMIENLAKGLDDWTPFLGALVFSITKKCVYRCEHCYAAHTLGATDVLTADDIIRIAKEFQKIGTAVMAWEGGEPLLRFEDLLRMIRETSPESESLIATTAYGLTDEIARRLKEAGLVQAIISLDHYEPDKHNEFRRNKKAFDMAVNGVRIFRENGILPSICFCATRETIEEDSLYKYIELAKDIGAAFVQVLDATPSGNYMGKDVILTKPQLDVIKRFHETVNTDPKYRDYPAVQGRALLEDEEHYGCCAGNALAYVDSSGNVQACDWLQISLGNVMEEDVGEVFARMKKYFPHNTRGRCPAQTMHKYIAAEYEKTGEMPVSYKDCESALEKIRDRGLPDRLEKVRAIKARKTIRDIFRDR